MIKISGVLGAVGFGLRTLGPNNTPAPISGAFFCANIEMWSPDDLDFSKHAESKFLIASWHELFYAFTPDSNQPRLHNVASLVEELADIAERWRGESRFQSHVGKVQQELKQSLAEEDDFLYKLPEYRSRAQQLVSADTPMGVLTGCQILIEQRSQYQATFIESAFEAIEDLPRQSNAVGSCRKQLGIATGLVSLYRNSQSLHVHPIANVRIDGSDVLFSQSEQAFRRLHPRAMAHDDIREGLDLLTQQQDVDKRLLGAIELLSLASSSSDSRVRLINLWSSIETLSGGHEGNTTLERVSSLLVPLIISRYVGRATRYLAIETQHLGSVLNRSDYGAGFSRSNKKFVSPQDMLKTLASPKDSQPIRDLLKFAQHPLLRYRIYCAWEVFHDPKTLRSKLSQSKKRLEWHGAYP